MASTLVRNWTIAQIAKLAAICIAIVVGGTLVGGCIVLLLVNAATAIDLGSTAYLIGFLAATGYAAAHLARQLRQPR